MNKKLLCKGLRRSILVILLSLICFASYSQTEADSLKARINQLEQQLKIKQDSIDLRQRFVQDSLIRVREKFVKDSILHRKQILDSLVFLQRELAPLFEAINWATREDIISYADKIAIIGDSVLGDYVYHKLPLGMSDPYKPWKGSLRLNDKHFRYMIDKKTKKINTIQAPLLNMSFNYANQGMLLVMQEAYVIQTNAGKYYKIPFDSIFFDRNKRIVKIKRYIQLYKLVNSNQKGDFMCTSPTQVKQYQYGANNQMVHYELVKFCDRFNSYDPKTVCSIITYDVAKENNNYLVTRHNNPANTTSDGTFILEFDEHQDVKNISFKDLKNTLIWQRLVEVNKDGNVSCYKDKSDGVIHNTICMIYHNEPNAKYPVETIYTTFEKDGIDYFQKNITTDKTRARNRLTMEWGPWK